MVRTAASLEHLDPAEKVTLGNWIVARLKHPATAGGPWAWALGRLGARVPLYGSGHKTVVARAGGGVAVACCLEAGLQRMDGDRIRRRATGPPDRRPHARSRRGRPHPDRRGAQGRQRARQRWLRMVTEVVALEAADEAQALGDTLADRVAAGLTAPLRRRQRREKRPGRPPVCRGRD